MGARKQPSDLDRFTSLVFERVNEASDAVTAEEIVDQALLTLTMADAWAIRGAFLFAVAAMKDALQDQNHYYEHPHNVRNILGF
jgi:hypothetical protein